MRKISVQAEVVSLATGYDQYTALFKTEENEYMEFPLTNDQYAKLRKGQTGILTYNSKYKEFIKFKN